MTESFKNRPEKCQAPNGGVIKHAQPLAPDREAIRRHLELLAPDNGSETLEVAFGKPEDGVHAIQLELSQVTYMEEELPFRYLPEPAAQVSSAIARMVETGLEMLKS